MFLLKRLVMRSLSMIVTVLPDSNTPNYVPLPYFELGVLHKHTSKYKREIRERDIEVVDYIIQERMTKVCLHI
ncbi:hypothetical protein SQ11_15720, partial [Nitrosospira sp. NpAV]